MAQITKDTIIGDVLDIAPECAPLFMAIGTVQPTRGLDVGAIEHIHKEIVAERDRGKAVLIVSLELDEVLSLSDRILVTVTVKISSGYVLRMKKMDFDCA